MDRIGGSDDMLPAALINDVETLAAAQNRPSRELLREAVERYVEEHRALMAPETKLTPQEAAARMLERRPFHKLPEGVTIRDLITYGRA